MPGFEIFGDEERQEVNDVLQTGVLFRYGFDAVRDGHWKAKTFEKELAQRLGIAHCHLCANGTAALITALVSCGIGAGDEVVVPPFTFVATFESILTIGATPVFADVDHTLCLDPDAVQSVITPRTRALIPVHMCGAMARIDKLVQVAEANDLVLIEDACQSVGGSFHGKALGTFGKMGCFSFDPVKTVTCGEGGAVVTNDSDLYRMADAYADHGHDHIGNDRGLEDHLFLGNNFRISELNAAVGLAQLRKLDQMLAKQRRTKQKIKAVLSESDAITFRELPDPEGDTATFLTFLLPDEKSARQTAKNLAKAKVDGCFYWYDNKWHYIRQWDHLKNWRVASKYTVQLGNDCPNYHDLDTSKSDQIIGRTISMLIKLSWTDEQINQRIESMMQVLNGL